MEVEGNTDRIRLLFFLHFLQNVQKSIDGMGVQAIPGGQRSYAKIGPVDDRVAIQNHQFHTFLHFAP